MLLTEEVANDRRLLLTPVQMRAHVGDEFGLVGRAALAQRIGLDVLVKQFVGIELGAVTRKDDQLKLMFVVAGEVAGGDAAVHGMSVNDEYDLGAALLEEPAHEVDEDSIGELAFEDTLRQAEVRLGVLGGSIISALLAFGIFSLRQKKD